MALAAVTPGLGAGRFLAESRRGAAGFFHAERNAAGQWWLIDPAGRPRWIRAVQGVRVAEPGGDTGVPRDAAARVRGWGFDAVGVGGDAGIRDDGFGYFASVDFCSAGPLLIGPGLRLPDVFDPQWPEHARRRAEEICRPAAEQRALIGWVTDDAPGWAQPMPKSRVSLLQLCLSLEPSFSAYHAAWEFALALHGGRLDALARAWATPLANREVVRELTRAEKPLGTRGYWRDEGRWTRELAGRYFRVTAEAIRGADPNHLLFGCRFGEAVGPHVLAECVYPALDIAMPDWRELPPAGAAGAANPVMAGDVSWTTADFVKLPAAARMLRLTTVEWMLRRGRAGLERAARHPAVIGYAWRQWQDDPGEQPPFGHGLVHRNGAEAREHTELLSEFNARAETMRRAAAPSLSP